MSQKSFVHLFRSSINYYLFDVNTDMILQINKPVFDFLQNQQENSQVKADPEVSNYVKKLQQDGFLSSNKVKDIIHPATEVLEYLISRKIHRITLQVTQNCNLRCDYCVYSGKYSNRLHNNKSMDLSIAKKGIDFLIQHSVDNKALDIGFYGGEPLINFELIKDCIVYAEKQAKGKELLLTLTTNGTLFTKEIIDFFVMHKVNVTISIDGPREIQNKNRKFAANKGSFDTLYKNIQLLKKDYPSYYKDFISFNMVLDPRNDLNCISDFVIKDDIFSDSIINSSVINDNYLNMPYEVTEDFIEKWEYEIFKIYLYRIHKLDRCYVPKILLSYYTHIKKSRASKQNQNYRQLPEKSHHGGPCIPGGKRLFMAADGTFYPCERVSECSEIMKIGNVETGIDIEKAKYLLNVGKITENQCKNCWAFKYCSICSASVDNLKELSPQMAEAKCASVRANVEEEFKNYCALRECGHDFME